jgi:drug/metabolite transporter (DMT)-like permease
MQNIWIIPIAIMALFNALSLVALKLASERSDIVMLGVVVTGSAFLSMAIFAVFYYTTWHHSAPSLPQHAIKWGMIAGVLSALIEVLFLMALSWHAPLGISVTILRVLSIVFAILLGLIIFKETLSIVNMIGVILSIVGVALVLT